MKELFFLCLFVGLESGICQEKDIPDWFLTPPSGEYVGVSLPLEQADQRENSALTAALLSYFAIHPGEVKEHENALVNALETVYDNGKSQRSKSAMKEMLEEVAQERFTRTLTQRIDYRIVRRFVNARGELFIAIQVKENGANTFSLRYEYSAELSRKGTEEQYQEVEQATITHSDEQMTGFSLFLDPSKETITIADKKSELLFSKARTKNADYIYRNPQPKNYKIYCSCALSLHVAYVKCLFSLLRRENRKTYRMELFNNELYLL